MTCLRDKFGMYLWESIPGVCVGGGGGATPI